MWRECIQCKVAKRTDTDFPFNPTLCRQCCSQDEGRVGKSPQAPSSPLTPLLPPRPMSPQTQQSSSRLVNTSGVPTAGSFTPASPVRAHQPYTSPAQVAPVAPIIAAAPFPERPHPDRPRSPLLSSPVKTWLRDPLAFLQELFDVPSWVPMSFDGGLTRLFCRVVNEVVALEDSEDGLSVQTAVKHLVEYFELPIEDAALLGVFAVPNEIIYQCYKTEGWLARALVASFNKSVIEPEEFDIRAAVPVLTKHPDVRSLLGDFLVDAMDQKPVDFFHFALSWIKTRTDGAGVIAQPRRTRLTLQDRSYDYDFEDMVQPRFTRVMREFVMYLSGLKLDDVYVTVHVDVKDLDPVQTDVYGLPTPIMVPALEWLQKRLNFLSKPKAAADLTKMNEDFIKFLNSKSHYPFANPVLTVLKRIAAHIELHHTLPPVSSSFCLDAEVLLMDELEMPLSMLTSEQGQRDAGRSWLAKVGLYLMERIPSSHPMAGNSTVTGKKTSYNEAKGLLGRMSDKQIYETFESILYSGFGPSIHAVFTHDKEKENYYRFVAVMAHYLWYLKEKQELMDCIKGEDLKKVTEQFSELTGPPFQARAKCKIDEKAVLLALRNQHFTTALMKATLFGTTPLVQTMLIYGAKSDSPIQESVLKQLLQYLLEVYYSFRRSAWRCFKCGHRVPQSSSDAQLKIIKCNQCTSTFDVSQGLYCPECPWDSCNECMTYITEGPVAELAFVCGRCTAPRLQKVEGRPLQCAICEKEITVGRGLQCKDCSYEVCASCQVLQAVNKMVNQSLEKKILHLLRILSNVGFEEGLKSRWPTLFDQFKVLPALTPLFLQSLQDTLQSVNPNVGSISDLVPDFRWFPYSAQFLAEVTGFTEVISTYKSNGFTLTDFEKSELTRYQKLRQNWLQGSTCCSQVARNGQQCACGFSQDEDLFFMEHVRLGKPQPKTAGVFPDYVANQMANIWPDLFPKESLDLWLAQTRNVVLLKLLQPKYGKASHDLAPRNIAAVFLYTLQTPIYQKLNAAFYKNDEKQQKNWQPFTTQLCKALDALPNTKFVDPPFSNFRSGNQRASFRGMGPYVDSSQYVEGKTKCLENFTSTSVSAFIAHCFGADGTILVTKLKSYKLISGYSDYPNEQEFLTPPGAQFKVKKVYRSPDFKTSETMSSIVPLVYFYFAMTQDKWDDTQWLLDEEAYGHADPNELPDTLAAIAANPLRSFHLMFNHLSYNLVFLEEIEKGSAPNS